MPGWVSGSSGGFVVSVEETVSLDEKDRARWIPSNAACAIRSLDGERDFVGSISPSISNEFSIGGVSYYLSKPGKGAVCCEVYSLDL
jgi:hypothetical protein